MKVWITQHALTKGIYATDAKLSNTSSAMVSVRCLDWTAFYHKPHWYATREEAVAYAEVMRIKKIASLRRQLVKLEALRFEEVTDDPRD